MGQTSHQLFDKTITLKRKRPSTEYDRDYSTTTTTTTATTATASNSMHARTAADGRARDGQSTPTLCDAISFLSLSCLNQQQRKREQNKNNAVKTMDAMIKHEIQACPCYAEYIRA